MKLLETFFNSAVSMPLIVVSKLLHIHCIKYFLKTKVLLLIVKIKL